MRFRSALLAAALSTATSVAGAQAPTPPAPPRADLLLGSELASITDTYTFSGCAEGWYVGAGVPFGTPFCIGGRLTRGPRVGTGANFNILALNVTTDPRVSRVDYEGGNTMAMFGTRTDASCPVGCSYAISFFAIRTSPPGTSFLFAQDEGVPPAAFRPERGRLFLDYRLSAGPPFTGGAFVDVELVPAVVPEPGTWALLGTGLLAVGAAARRRRGA